MVTTRTMGVRAPRPRGLRSADVTLQAEWGDQPAVGEHAHGPCVFPVQGDGDLAGVGNAEQDADHTVLARQPRNLAGIAIDEGAVHARQARSGA